VVSSRHNPPAGVEAEFSPLFYNMDFFLFTVRFTESDLFCPFNKASGVPKFLQFLMMNILF
jgi:hypothetical protein